MRCRLFATGVLFCLAAQAALPASPAHTALPKAPQAPQAPAPAPSQALSLEQAQALLLRHSSQLAASQAQLDSARLRRAGMQGLGRPSLALQASGYVYSVNADLGLGSFRQAVAGALAQWPGDLAHALGPAAAGLPAIPDSYALRRRDERATASISGVWPLYTGGLTQALRHGLEAAEQEAAADASLAAASLQRQLIERYFDAQLAERAATLRERALQAVREHDLAAQRMEQAGVIAHVERLQARSALADAAQQALQARDAARLAQAALQNSIGKPGPLRLSTPLFVQSQPLPPLAQFVAAAQRQHPGLDKIRAKRGQAQALRDAQQARRKPSVLAFANHELPSSGKPSWVAGVALRWTLWDGIDHRQLAQAAQQQVQQAEHSQRQALQDIALLVEKHWLDAEHARTRYLAQQDQQQLAQELLRLRQAGLRAGASTALDLMDAQLQLAKVQTERAQSANQYVKALAALLESSGQGEQFTRYQQQADIQILPDTP
ncbi:TolC family protein [Vandammella animalimorsus]|uniref:TolC family protein n=1 Tax=Vandammella animalimorsus TaxID=2029117 RepID=UPI001EEF4239|nr:TolC family protein [Vandammella animalimorsus]